MLQTIRTIFPGRLFNAYRRKNQVRFSAKKFSSTINRGINTKLPLAAASNPQETLTMLFRKG